MPVVNRLGLGVLLSKEAFMKKMMLIAVIALPLLMFAEEKTVGFLGVTTQSVSEAMKIALDIEYGLVVNKVFEESPADKADIEVGDIIMEIDGDKITDNKILKNAISTKPGKKVKIVLHRSKKTITKNVELGAKEKTPVNVMMDIPNFGDIRDLMGRGTKELKKEIEQLKEEIEKIKKELEELKAQLK